VTDAVRSYGACQDNYRPRAFIVFMRSLTGARLVVLIRRRLFGVSRVLQKKSVVEQRRSTISTLARRHLGASGDCRIISTVTGDRIVSWIYRFDRRRARGVSAGLRGTLQPRVLTAMRFRYL